MVTGVIRTIILYLLIIVGIRIMGKRQVGELEPSELVLDLMIADLAVVPMQDFGIPLAAGILPIITLLCVTMILSVFTMKSVRFRALICGRPSIVISNGVLNQKAMTRNRFTIDELNEEFRMQGYTDFSLVKYAILETNGRVSVIPFASEHPVTASQMNIQTQEPGLPMVIINDGHLLEHNMRSRGLDPQWLSHQLKTYGASSPHDIFLLSVDECDQVYCARKELPSK